MKSQPARLSFLKGSALVLLGLTAGVHAAPYTWDGGTGNWNDINWNTASASGPTSSGNTAVINSGNVTANVGVGGVDSITLGSGAQLNFYNGAYQGVGNLVLQGGTVSGSGNYNAYGASIISGLTVSGSVASTITGGSWFNLNPITTFTVADVTGNSSTDLLVSTSLRGPVGSPDTNYNTAKLIKEGLGTMEVTQHSYFRGGLDLNGGTLKLSGGNGGYGFFDGTVTVNSGTTLSMSSDGTGFGYQSGWKPATVNIVGGTVTTTGDNHIWGIGGGVNMTGGSIQSSGSLQWNYTGLTTLASANTATISGTLNLRGDGGYSGLSVSVADGAAATDLLISANITQLYGNLGITKSGAGTMVLSGNNSYYGNTTLSAGTLEIAATGKLYAAGYTSGPVVSVAGGTVLRLHGWNYDAVGSLGDLDFSRDRFIVNGGTIEYAGSSNTNDGGAGRNLTVGTGGATLKTTTAGQTWSIVANGGYGDLINNNGLTLGGAGNGLIGKPISGSGSLTKTDSGTWTLTGIGSFSGGTTVNSGTLELSSTAFDQSVIRGTLTVNSGATVSITGYDYAGLGRLYGANVTTLNVNGGTVNNSVQSWLTGAAANLTGGTMTGGNFHILNSSLNSKASAVVSTISSGLLVRKDYGSADVSIDVEDGAAATDLLISGGIVEVGSSAAFTKTGAGTLVLSGNNSYTGSTTINNGLVIAQNGTGIPDLSTVVMANASGAALQITASEQVGLLSGGGASGGNISVASGATLSTGENGGSASYDGVISGSNVSLRKRGGGTQTLTGDNTFSGGVEIVSGTLAVPSITTPGLAQPLGMGTGPILFTGAGGLSITGAGSYSSSRGLTLADNANALTVAGELTLTGAITGGGSSASLTKAGAGTFNQAGTSTWSGNIFLTQGTYNVTSTGSIGTSGSAGVIQLTGGSTFNIDSTTQVRAASIQIDAGTVNLNAGTLRTNGITVAGGSAFNWSAGTLTMQTDAAGSSGVTDRRAPGSSLSALPVYEGRIIDVTGLSTLAVPNGGSLDLGPTYGSFGMRYDQLKIAGSLDLSAPGSQALNFEFNPFFFRPSSYGADAAGTLILVDAGSFTGTFESFTGVYSDYIGFGPAPGSGSVVGVLGISTLNPLTDIPVNTYYLEYETDTGNVLFHYRLSATIPEPASAGLIAMGTMLLRVMRRRKG